jgi:hypothetical protein
LTKITEDGEAEDRGTISYPAKEEETKSEPFDSNSDKEEYLNDPAVDIPPPKKNLASSKMT